MKYYLMLFIYWPFYKEKIYLKLRWIQKISFAPKIKNISCFIQISLVISKIWNRIACKVNILLIILKGFLSPTNIRKLKLDNENIQ
jgi:hypothetical protein